MKLALRMTPLFLALALGFYPASAEKQKSKASASLETASGLHSIKFETAQGRITVNLPDDMAGGDTISGTVIAEPAARTPSEREKNLNRLDGYVVELGEQKQPVRSKLIRWAVPAGTAAASLVLRDKDGKEVARTEVPVAPQTPPRSSTPAPTDFALPPICQAGRPIQITGPFDGDLSNTSVSVGGKSAQLLAESPRKLVAASPSDVVGPVELSLKERGQVQQGEVRNLRSSSLLPRPPCCAASPLRSPSRSKASLTSSGRSRW